MPSQCAKFALFALLLTPPALGQPAPSSVTIPPNFAIDAVFAARIRSQLLPRSEPAPQLPRQVMDRLVQQLPAAGPRFSWDLRLARDAGNVFSSPDGTIYFDPQIADLLGSQAGLWAAALSHEIAHVVRRDWARRYLFEKSLQQSQSLQMTLGDPGASGSWRDARGSADLLARFLQNMELEADAQSLLLMAHAGFHPDFVPALHHLLQAQPGQFDQRIFDPSHPRWDDRDQKLQKLFVAAQREFDRLWPDRYASPGGNPPIVVYAGSPNARRDPAGLLEVQIPLHCQNLSGSVEVVLRWTPLHSGPARELRQFTGCTSDHTLVAFTVSQTELPASDVQTEISVLDDNGSLLSRFLTPRPLH